MDLGIVLYALIHTGATLTLFRTLRPVRERASRMRRALRTAVKIEVV